MASYTVCCGLVRRLVERCWFLVWSDESRRGKCLVLVVVGELSSQVHTWSGGKVAPFAL